VLLVSIIRAMMEAASTSETANFYQTTRRNIPQGSHLTDTSFSDLDVWI
jgi:hypothetical protein